MEQSATRDKSLSLGSFKRKLKTYLLGQCQWRNSIRRPSDVLRDTGAVYTCSEACYNAT